MSLTSHLKDKNSLIKKMFDEQFNNMDLFLKKENEEIKNIPVIIPTDEKNYPWSTVGHITEYLLALYIGLPIEDLFPMQWLEKLNPKQYNQIKSYNIKKEHLDSEYLPNIISITLYRLALYEAELRINGKNALYQFKKDGVNLKLSDIATQDIINIFKNSLKLFPDASYGYNPSFDPEFTKYIGGADADLIQYKDTGNLLIDVKTTKNNKLEKSWLFQLMDYVALDKENEHDFKNIGIYLPRQNKLLEYNIEEFLNEYTQFKSLKEFKNAFGYTLITQRFPQLLEEKNIIKINFK